MSNPELLTPDDLDGAASRGGVTLGEEAVSLFALVDGAAAFLGVDAEGDPFIPPIVHRAGPVGALISVVPLDDYSGVDAADRLSDLAWLAPRTMRHAAVLRWAMQYSPVYPAPFATLFANLGSLTTFMLLHGQTLSTFFGAVAGMAEWELKASACVDSRPALETLARDAWSDWAQLTPGTRYLRLSRDRSSLICSRRVQLQDISCRLAQQLQPLATSVRQLHFQPLAGAENGELVGRFALLVSANDASALAQCVQGLAAEANDDGIELTLSGPWPPFSFRPDLPGPAPQIAV